MVDKHDYKVLHLFLVSGKTFTFNNIEFVFENESQLVINYESGSDGTIKEAKFWKDNMVGISWGDYEEEA